MIIKKRGKTSWKYNGKLSAAILHEFSLRNYSVNEIVYAIVRKEKKDTSIVSFFAEGFRNGSLVIKLDGKAIALDGYVHIIISSVLKY